MKWTWIVALASLGLLIAVGLMVFRQSHVTPREEFRAIQQRMARGNFDREQTIAKLNAALVNADESRDVDLTNEIHLSRGKLLMQVGAFERARNDLTVVWEARGGDQGVERLLVDLEQRAGDYRAALLRVGHLIETDGSHAEDWRTKGELHRAAAEKSLDQRKQAMSKVLIPAAATQAEALLDRAAALDPQDPRRVAIGRDLHDLFKISDEGEAERALATADTCSRDLAAARAALAQSLSLEFDAKAFTSLVELYRRAGHVAEAVDLCTAAWRIPSLRTQPETALFLLDALSELGRSRHAAEVATYAVSRGQGMPKDFYLDSCRVLAKAKQWGSLTIALDQLSALASPADLDLSLFYSGLASAGMGLYANARSMLVRFLNTKAPDPYPGARAQAWREIARCARQLGRSEDEREALEVAVDLEPDYDGTLWLRLAELQLATPHAGFRQPETRWAKGMSLLPTKVSELLTRWREIGEQELKSLGIDIESRQALLVSERTWIPSPDASPYELYRMARLQLDDGDLPRAENSVKRLLEIVPDFVPALDLALEVAEKSGKQRDVIAALLARIKQTGPDEKARAVLARIRSDLLTKSDVLALMRASPARFGRLAVARTYLAHGDVERALATLEHLSDDTLGDEGRLLMAELELKMQRPDDALKTLEPLGQRVLKTSAGQNTLVDCALGAGDQAILLQRMSELASSGEPDKARWLALCDRMLAAGATTPARVLLRRLDSQPRTRGGDVLVRLAAALVAEGGGRELTKVLTRAQSSDDRGDIEHVSLIARAAEGAYDDLKSAVANLRASKYDASRLESALLDLIAGDPVKAQRAIASFLESDPRDTEWQLASAIAAAEKSELWSPPVVFGHEAAAETELFVRGPAPMDVGHDAAHDDAHDSHDSHDPHDNGQGIEKKPAPRRDPRWAACVLFAMQSPLGRAWAEKELAAATPESHGELWPAYCRALLASSIGDGSGARRSLEEVVARAPDFGPAWKHLEDLAKVRNDDGQALSDLRLRRTQAMGEQNIPIAMQWLDKARVLQLRGDDAAALEAAVTAASLDSKTPEISAKLGELCAANGQYERALAAYRTATADLSAVDRSVVHDFLDVLDEAERTVPPALTATDHMAELERIAALAPDDPFLAVAMARMDVKLDTRNPSFAVARAYARLDRFRLRHKDHSLESLSPGSAAAWVDFHLVLDPSRAEKLLESELELEPGALAPWLLLGRVYTAEGKTKEAVDQFAIAFGLAPQKHVTREHMRARVWTEMSVDAVTAIMRQVMEAEGRTRPDEELLGLAARALYNLGPSGVGRAIPFVEPGNVPSDNAPSAIERIGWMRALVWTARGEPDDLVRAQKTVNRILPLIVDPYKKTMAIALLGIARAVTAPRAP